jgi:LuxR family transcriptional regulator, maltose regulon positive regulatory protein
MDETEKRQRPIRIPYASGPEGDFFASKLRAPPTRAGAVCRSSVIDQLAQDNSRTVVSVVAPAGYGKTTLLSQWAERSRQAFAWVSVGETDNDPKVLLSYVAAALDAVEPIDGRVFDALASPVSSVPGSVVPRLEAAFWSMTTPVVLVLDDVHLLRDRECRDALSVMAEHVPAGSRMVLASREQPPLRLARLRAEGRVAEISVADLSLPREQAAALLRAAGVTLAADELAVLHQRTEGWPAGLYLAALSLREGGSLENAVRSFGGDDRLVKEYIESEVLARISPRHRMFLTRTAVLERMCGALCDAVLEMTGGATALADLERSNLLLVPLDRRGRWYRYHHLFRDVLLAELERLEPWMMPPLRRRAAAWCLGHDLAEEAVEYSIAAGDVGTVARLVGGSWASLQHRRHATLLRWLRWLDDHGAVADQPMLAMSASMLAAFTGRPAEAGRWADAVDRWCPGDGTRSAGPVALAWAAVLRAMLCRHGARQMKADAEQAARAFAAEGILVPAPSLLRGIACVLAGEIDDAVAFFTQVLDSEVAAGVPEVLGSALSQLSLVAMTRDRWAEAEAFAGQADAALRRASLEGPLECAVRARVALHRGDLAAVRRELVCAQRLRPVLTYALPYLAVQARIELARVYLALADLAGARTLIQEADEVLRLRPCLGILVGEAGEMRARLAKEGGPSAPEASSLTAAELRVLPMLATHLSFREIGAELSLSPHTVKSQAISAYRKLGASSRSQAVTRCRELGLLEG